MFAMSPPLVLGSVDSHRRSMGSLMNCSSLTLGFVIALLLVKTAMADPPNEAADERHMIPLSKIVTMGPQKGLQYVRVAWQQTNDDQSSEVFLQQMHNISRGGSNVFLVDAINLHDALSASFSALAGSRAADTPAPVETSNPKKGSHWLVAYLGTGPGNPTWWTVESVVVDQGKVALNYRKAKPQPATDDVQRYYYWVPLGKLDPGAYELQLVDADKGAVTLMRRVEITPNNAKGGTQ